MPRRLTRRVSATVVAALCVAGLGAMGASAKDMTVGRSCAQEWTALLRSHPAVGAALGNETRSRIERAAQAHGREVLVWYADLIDNFVRQDTGGIPPARKAFFQASSAYLRCRHASLPLLPDWQINRADSSVPTSWALPGDLLLTDGGCGVFLRGEVSGIPGTGNGQNDRTAWRWNGTCKSQIANGRGLAEQVLRSGEIRAGLLGNGFPQSTLRNGRLDGFLQVTDKSRDDPAWRDHFDLYENGRVVGRAQRREGNAFISIDYRNVDGIWRWVDLN